MAPLPVLCSVPPAHWTTCRWPLCKHSAVPLPVVLSLCSLLFSNTQPAEGRPALNSWGHSSPPEPEPSRQDSRELPGRHCPPPLAPHCPSILSPTSPPCPRSLSPNTRYRKVQCFCVLVDLLIFSPWENVRSMRVRTRFCFFFPVSLGLETSLMIIYEVNKCLNLSTQLCKGHLRRFHWAAPDGISSFFHSQSMVGISGAPAPCQPLRGHPRETDAECHPGLRSSAGVDR